MNVKENVVQIHSVIISSHKKEGKSVTTCMSLGNIMLNEINQVLKNTHYILSHVVTKNSELTEVE